MVVKYREAFSKSVSNLLDLLSHPSSLDDAMLGYPFPGGIKVPVG